MELELIFKGKCGDCGEQVLIHGERHEGCVIIVTVEPCRYCKRLQTGGDHETG